MKVEVILNGVGSITVEDDVNHSPKAVQKFVDYAWAKLAEGPMPGRVKLGFAAGGGGQFENNSGQETDHHEGVIYR